MSSIASCAISLPGHQYNIESIRKAGIGWLQSDGERLDLLLRLIGSSNVETRGFVLPLERIVELGGLSDRAELFERLAPELALPSIEQALAEARLDPSEIDAFIFTSCSVPSIPCIDALLLERAGLSRHIRRVPIFQHGCAGGVVGLELAHEFAAAGRNVLLTSTEICSLLFHHSDARGGQLVGAALFSDGAASVVVKPKDGKAEILATSSCLLPETRHLMGYELQDDGLHLLLDRQLPSALSNHIPRLVDQFLMQQGLARNDVNWWLFHPGGPKILGGLQRSLELEENCCRFAGEILSEHGNMSSATILFVMKRFFDQSGAQPGDLALICGVGPGLTIELVLLRVS